MADNIEDHIARVLCATIDAETACKTRCESCLEQAKAILAELDNPKLKTPA